jgi:cell shape-determining protein MreC
MNTQMSISEILMLVAITFVGVMISLVILRGMIANFKKHTIISILTFLFLGPVFLIWSFFVGIGETNRSVAETKRRKAELEVTAKKAAAL